MGTGMALGPAQKTVLNERLKLVANTLDRLATVCMTVGVLAPTAKAIVDPSVSFEGTISLSWLAVLYVTAAAVLHLVAQSALGNMQ
jgi:hypothetical protein